MLTPPMGSITMGRQPECAQTALATLGGCLSFSLKGLSGMAFRFRRQRAASRLEFQPKAGRGGKRRSPARRRRVGIEVLEDRSMLSITLNWTGPFRLAP